MKQFFYPVKKQQNFDQNILNASIKLPSYLMNQTSLEMGCFCKHTNTVCFVTAGMILRI